MQALRGQFGAVRHTEITPKNLVVVAEIYADPSTDVFHLIFFKQLLQVVFHEIRKHCGRRNRLPDGVCLVNGFAAEVHEDSVPLYPLDMAAVQQADMDRCAQDCIVVTLA